MTHDEARVWIVKASLYITGGLFAFFLLAPAVRYPLLWEQSFKVFEIILPVFFGYLGSATHFVFRTKSTPKEGSTSSAGEIEKNPDSTIGQNPLLSLLMKGPIIIFVIASIVALIAFGLSNSRFAPEGSGIKSDTLATVFSVLLGLLAVTTNIAASYLFAAEQNAQKPQPIIPKAG